jgi:hypothetical protein
MSDHQDQIDAGRDGDGIDDAREAAIEDGDIDGAPEPVTPRDEQELRAQLEREMRFDGFEQGMQG